MLKVIVKLVALLIACTFIAVMIVRAVDGVFIQTLLSHLRNYPAPKDTAELANQVKRTIVASVFGPSATVGLLTGIIELAKLLTRRTEGRNEIAVPVAVRPQSRPFRRTKEDRPKPVLV